MGQPKRGESLLFDVPLLLEKLPKPCLPLRERGTRDETSKPDAIIL
jgi:hypothetical protein